MMKRLHAFLTFFVLFLSVLSFPITHSISIADAAPVSVATGTITSDFVFGAGKTYLVSGPTVMTGAVIIEGNAIIKFDDAVTGASLDIANPTFKTTSSSWAIFTSKHDNTLGEVITGSTGTPGVAQYANALTLGAAEVRFVQVRYADVGIQFQGGGAFTLRDSEFFAVNTPLNALPNTSASSVTLNNVLVAFGTNGPTIVDDGINPLTVTANNLTFYSLSGYGFDTTLTSVGSTFSVVDSVFVDIQGTDVFKGSAPGVENFNAFFQTPQNGTGVNDLVLTADPLLTDFFIDQSSLPINAGSKSALDAGLYHHTTNTDKTREANTPVDMGYHIPPDLGSFSILATNSIWLKKNSMSTGNIGVNGATAGPWVNTQAQLVVGKNVVIPAEISLFADSIKIKKDAVINGGVYTNLLDNKGTINGPVTNPLGLPLFDLLPVFRSAVVGIGASNIEVPNGQEVVLAPGEYGDIIVKKNGSLKFTGGVYNILSIDAKKFSSLSFEAVSEVRIQQTLRTKKASFVGPATGSNLNAEDIQFFIEGTDDGSTPRTAKFGQSNSVDAHFYVPNGTIWLKKGTVASGAFFAKNVIVGQNTDVSEETGTSTPEVAAPIIAPNGGSFFDSVSVNMSTITTGASIHYTLDGTTPTTASTLFTGPFSLTNDATVSAIAVRNGFIDSAEASAVFVVQPRPQVNPVAFSPAPNTFQNSVDVTLSTTTSGATIHYTLDGTTPTTASPIFSTAINLTATTTVTTFAVKQDFTDSSITSASYTIETGPPDPSTIAPPLDDTLIANVASSTEFLYTGSEPLQTGVLAGTINPIQAAVVRGRVLNSDGTPLPAVTVTILNHPEFGQTVSRSDGFFDMAVNGGGLLTVDFQLTGYLPAQRQVDVPWQDFAIADDVALVPLDPQVTNIDLAAITQITEARGSVETDSDGTRQATLLFSPGTTAEMVLPGGTTQPITNFNFRATEFTVGPDGPMAMPAKLPASSAYTYAAAFTLDEAIALNVKRVNFSQPVYGYVENFLGFSTGTAVPSGFYDMEIGQWLPETSGLVIKILSITGGEADVDLDGDDVEDDITAPQFTSLGLTSGELVKLAGLYTAGQSLWRVPYNHLSIYDLNWSIQDALDAILPKVDPAEENQNNDNPVKCPGCIIHVESQVLGEQIPVVGTPFSLAYVSDRTSGYKANSTINIPVTGETSPSQLTETRVRIDILGRRFEFVQPVTPNLSIPFTWDGLDAYGRPVTGAVDAQISIDYGITVNYGFTSTFGSPGDGDTGVQARVRFLAPKRYTLSLSSNTLQGYGLGSWTLDQLHYYDPFGKTLHLGNGDRRSAESLTDVITTFAGTGNRLGFGTYVDGSDAISTDLDQMQYMAVDAQGNIFAIIAIGINGNHIVKITPDGKVFRVAGLFNVFVGYNGDEIPATTALLRNPQGIAVDAKGNIYIADANNFRVRMIDSDGIIHTVAGNGTQGSSGDGGLATNAQINRPRSVAVDNDGNLYIADRINRRIRKVDTNGIITTFAGTGGATANTGDGGPATSAVVFPTFLTFDNEGNLYLIDLSTVRKITKDGIINTVAGIGVPDNGTGPDPFVEGIPATQAVVSASSLAFDKKGNMYITTLYGRVLVVDSQGIITTFMGERNQTTFNGDGLPLGTAVADPRAVVFGPDDNMYLADRLNSRIRKITLPLPGFTAQNSTVVSQDGTELYVFDSSGRHLRTINTSTGADVWLFAYDTEGRLSTVTDGDGDVTTVQRDASGNPTGITSADGQTTVVGLDANGYLSGITNPANETNLFTYTPEGLMTKRTDPRLNDSIYTYNTEGKLTQDADPAGGSLNLARTGTNDDYTVTNTTALGRVSSFAVDNAIANGKNLRTNTDPSGFATTTLLGTDQSQTITNPDGTTTVINAKPDPRWGMQSPLSDLTVTTPGGLISNLTTTRNVTLSDPLDPLSLTTQTDTLNLNGRTFTSLFDKNLLKITDTTPVGRTTTAFVDSQGRILIQQVPNLEDTVFGYDLRGRLNTVTQSTGATARASTIAYDAAGFIDSITDPESRVVSFQYDLSGKVTKQILPDLREINFTYDNNGNVASITPPGRPAHVFNYTAVNLESDYTPPVVTGSGTNATLFTYNLDKQLTLITRPDAQTVALNYDTGGRLGNVVIPRGTTTYAYFATTGNLSSITAPDTGTLTFAYDGSLLTNSTWAGTVAGSVTRTYDTDFRVASRSVNGANTISFGYDADSLLTVAGAETLTYDPTNGLLTETTLGVVTDSLTYNGFAEVDSYTANVNATAVFATSFVRDKLGRISQKTETVQGVTHVFDYTYDTAGRLTNVDRDSLPFASYTYDSNGNRLNNGAIYDDQDRLTSTSSATYTYSANGELLTKTNSSGTTTYSYGVLGNLISVILPSGTTIEYLVDGRNRRIGEKVNGTLERSWLYKDGLNPVTELDGTGAVVSRFVYSSRANVPDFIIKGGVTYRIISDHLGSPRLVVDTVTGAVVQTMDYDEFGNVIADTNPEFQPFGFAGGLYDTDTKLVRFGARDYDAEIGRWTSKDPILFGGGDTNLFGYVFNDPINFLDPIGLLMVEGSGPGAIRAYIVPDKKPLSTPVEDAVKRQLRKAGENINASGSLTGSARGLTIRGTGSLTRSGGSLTLEVGFGKGSSTFVKPGASTNVSGNSCPTPVGSVRFNATNGKISTTITFDPQGNRTQSINIGTAKGQSVSTTTVILSGSASFE
jgi:RHS repeat-associated protein